MTKVPGFLPRREFRAMAQSAYRLFITRAINHTIESRGGIDYRIDVNSELDTVFIDFVSPGFGDKVSVHPIRKSWGA